jgi:hypothetical protein
VPWTALFDPRVFEYSGNFPGYELLAAGAVVAIATVALIRGQDIVRVLGFAVAAIAGAVAVFSAFAPEFGSPVQTFAGWGIAGCAVLSFFTLAPRGLRSLKDFFRL